VGSGTHEPSRHDQPLGQSAVGPHGASVVTKPTQVPSTQRPAWHRDRPSPHASPGRRAGKQMERLHAKPAGHEGKQNWPVASVVQR
jgi:hypothetical protein